jgi:hypothetical protein
MELNFDKEMDALLRQAARQDKSALPVTQTHLDADELAAFAAGALPLKARARAVEHLADCGNCRTTVANLVFFENEAEEMSSAASARGATGAAPAAASLLDRIKTFFTIPTLAYAMAGLVLVFAGMFAVVFYRSSSGDLQMAQANTSVMDKSSGGKGMSSDGAETYVPETFSTPSAAMNTNSVSNSASTAAPASAPVGGVVPPPSPRYAANTASNEDPADKEIRTDKLGYGRGETQIKKDVSVDGALKATDEAPAPARQEEPALAKPQVLDQYLRNQTQDIQRSNSNMMPDGGNDKGGRRATSAEAGANVMREADRDEKTKQASSPPPPASKTEVKKTAVKKTKKKPTSAAAEAEPAPSPTPKPPTHEDPY